MTRRIAIVNRGDPARRLIQAAREFGAEGRGDLRTIAFHAEGERTSAYVRLADERELIRSSDLGNPYRDLAELERALVDSRADAVWVGWGFVAEDPEFAELCERLGVLFVGPPPEVIRKLGDKMTAKSLAEEAGLTVPDWSREAVKSADEAVRHAERLGYPLMVKAAMGRGGRGIRAAASAEELRAVFEDVRAEAWRAFGDDRMFLERLVPNARCIEVDVIADAEGNAWSPGLRDCTVQRSYRKLIEESASPDLGAARSAEIRHDAVNLMLRAGYRSAGTVEFLFQPDDGSLYFTEVNPRLQVGHSVTEVTTDLDLVKLQLHVAFGGSLDPEPPTERGHAIEVRLNAEDAERGFAPAPGELDLLALPTGPGVRIDTGLTEGDTIPPDYDALIAKVIARGRDRPEALARLRRAIGEMAVIVRGGATNRSLLLDLVDRPEFVSGAVDTGWLDRLEEEEGLISEAHADVALVYAAIAAYDADEAVARRSFYASARRGRPQASDQAAGQVELRRRGHDYRLSVARAGASTYRVSVDGQTIEADLERLGRFGGRIGLAGRTHRVLT
ncbi:MAG: acetyl-CoA carboxylase biotin carboxylase subunit, partial [Miltoncostaeaceae bacterium]